MKWERKGLIFDPAGKFSWASHYALQPTPLLLEDRIRIFCGFRDDDGVSRVGSVDVDVNDPRRVLDYSKAPLLDIGKPGCFDEFGVVPSVVLKQGNQVYLYYAGYQLGLKVRFLVLGGLAISNDNGRTFTRVQETPVFERTPEELLFKVPHSVLPEKGKFRIWYGGGSEFAQGETKTLPVYNIRYTETEELTTISQPGKMALDMDAGEYRLGRPYVVKRNDRYEMYYGYSTEFEPYQLGFAYSVDGGHCWIRDDEQLNLPLSESGWDSEMMAYPSLVSTQGKTYLFYNGNNYGYQGFGFAELMEK